MHDLVIRGAHVIDGTGSPARRADVAVSGGRIVEVGEVSAAARERVEAGGLWLTPGFVDAHSHFDGQICWDPELSPVSWHGVTTTVMGNCGVGFAPVRPGQEKYLVELMESVEDIPAADLAKGIPFGWETFPQYLDALARWPLAIDVATQVPHCAVRVYVMGERGARNEAASPAEIAEMARIVREGVAAGALGFSSSRTLVHTQPSGEPVPGTFAAEEELRAILRAMGELGQGLFEVAGRGAGGEDSAGELADVAMFERLAEDSGRPVLFILLQNDGAPGQWREILARCQRARARGVQLVPQVHARGVGFVMSFASGSHPFSARPSWQAIADEPPAQRLRTLRDPAFRARLLGEPSVHEHPLAAYVLENFDRIFPLGDPPDYEPPAEASIAARARREGRRPEEVAYDLLLEGDGSGMLLRPVQNYSEFSLDHTRELLEGGQALLGLADGGAHCAQTCDTSAPTFALAHWVQGRARGARLPLELVVRRLSRDPAQVYGLRDRGCIAPGLRADLNLIDPSRLRLRLPRVVRDFPAGGARLVQDAEGYVATWVAGEAIRREGLSTGARPGALVRGAR